MDKHNSILFNEHHLVPKSRGGSNLRHNLKTLRVVTHNALHTLFDNKMPHEQIEHLIELNTTALKKEFRKELLYLLQQDDKYIYQNGVFVEQPKKVYKSFRDLSK